MAAEVVDKAVTAAATAGAESVRKWRSILFLTRRGNAKRTERTVLVPQPLALPVLAWDRSTMGHQVGAPIAKIR